MLQVASIPVLLLTLALAALNAEPAAAQGVDAEAAARQLGGNWRFPGEYERHEAMWMLWPTYENKAGFPSTEPILDMIAALHGHVQVNLAVQDAADESAAIAEFATRGVARDHVRFLELEHGDIWARDMGPQFVRNRAGQLRVTDWNFNMWGNEEPDSANSALEENFDRIAAKAIGVAAVDTLPEPTRGVRMIHEGGSASHNGFGTMIAVESVVIQRNLGPQRFCGGQAPVTDYQQPNTYAPNPSWPACKARVEAEYRRLLGVEKVIWIPTGVIEDNGTYRGALGQHIRVPELDGIKVPHAGVYTLFTTNGHPDEFLRFAAADVVLLAEETIPNTPTRTPVEKLIRWLQEQNRARLERVYEIVSHATTAQGAKLQVVRIPVPVLTLEVFEPGDGLYDYYAEYDRWEDGSTLPDRMLAVWPSSYVNYVPTNGVVLVTKLWKPGRPLEAKRRDEQARRVLQRVFPDREIVQIFSENVNRGGGGMNCITQQQPASTRF